MNVSSDGLSARDRMDLIALALASEESLGASHIDAHFQPEFFTSNFWFMWCTTFAFQRWHSATEFKRYLLRFIQEFPRINTLAGVKRTAFNQYDSFVQPLVKWLISNGVHFEMNSQVVDIDFHETWDETSATCIYYRRNSELLRKDVHPGDLVFITLGSMTAGSTIGSMNSSPSIGSKEQGGSWMLWEKIAEGRPSFGRPITFDDDIKRSMWESFTLTLSDPLFFFLMNKFTGNEAGTGGLVTFKDSNWLMSIVLPHQPHFLDQPENVQVCWGYGLFPNEEGNYVKKRMADCTGAEILSELLSHLKFDEVAPSIQKLCRVLDYAGFVRFFLGTAGF